MGDLASGLSSVCGLRDISYPPDPEKSLLNIPQIPSSSYSFWFYDSSPNPLMLSTQPGHRLWCVPATVAQPAGTERRAIFKLEIIAQGKNQSHFTCRTRDKYTHVYT